jgi:hypothetical protein
MPIEMTVKEIAQKHQETVDSLNNEKNRYVNNRENQIDGIFKQNSEVAQISFLILGAIIGLNPDIIARPFILAGSFIVLMNAFIFGLIAQYRQRHLNAKNWEKVSLSIHENFIPVQQHFKIFVETLDQNQSGAQQALDAYQLEFLAFQTWYAEQARFAKFPKITLFGIGVLFYLNFLIGITLLALGLLFNEMSDKKWDTLIIMVTVFLCSSLCLIIRNIIFNFNNRVGQNS